MSAERIAVATPRGAPRVALGVLLVALASWSAGCGSTAVGAPRVTVGTPCATCGMDIRDLRYACAVRAEGRTRLYDSIECALRGDAGAPGASIYLADFATGALHAADSVWVVRADIPSPMGGGYAAFLERREADRVAATRSGRADRLAGFLVGAAEGGR